jgi:hypothetical protein
MALSPEYGWPEPDNSSLVKNGAQDIRALGDAIDTSVWNVGYGQAAKNKIINGDFSINQRAFTSTTTSGTFGFDRWTLQASDGTVTYSAETFTLGSAPVAGYESANFGRIVTTGQTLSTASAGLIQRIESVRTFAGQTVTVSFWAKAASGTPKIAVEFGQNFGSGGSSTVFTLVATPTLSTSWARYSGTVTVPSISGKTIAGGNDRLGLTFWVSAGSDLNSRTNSLGIQSNTFDIWGVQAEYGSKATPFQTATGTIQGELAACERYYQRVTTTSSTGIQQGWANGTTVCDIFWRLATMRVAPTSMDVLNLEVYRPANGTTYSGGTTTLNTSVSQDVVTVRYTHGSSVFTAAENLVVYLSTGYLGLSAEL